MKLPFSREQFLQILSEYNLAVYPVQIFLNLMAVFAILLCFSKKANASKTINAILTFFWLWMGIAYHLRFFTSINKAAYLFGAAFIVEACLFAYFGVLKNRVTYKASFGTQGILAIIFLLFSLIIYPLLGLKFGHVYPASPSFGLPCPTTIFTFGILLWQVGKIRRSIIVIPLVWALIGFTAAFKMKITEDVSLLLADVIVMGVVLTQKRNQAVSVH